MRRMRLIAVCLLCCIFLAACGGREEENTGQSGILGQQESSAAKKDNEEKKEKGDTEAYYDIETDTGIIFDIMSTDWEQAWGTEGKITRTMFLGMQFYKEEPVQLWGAVILKEESEQAALDVYLCMEDGSSRLLFSGLPQDYAYRDWFLDQEGNAYVLGFENMMKFGADGEVLFDRKSSVVCQEICQLPDGSIYMLVLENGQGTLKLAGLDPVSGSLSILDELGWSRIPMAIGVGEDGLLYMDGDGFWNINLKEKSQTAFLLFEGTVYYEDWNKRTIQGIRMSEDGSVQILRSNGRSVNSNDPTEKQGYGELEILRVANVAEDKIPIVMRGMYFNFTWTKEQVARFNQSQTDYYVVLDEWPEESDLDDFVKRTGVEIATGKGPDILCGEFMEDSIYSLIQKGVFEDLKPYMDKSGICEEDYFPMAFSSWRDGEEIYSINSFVKLEGYRIDEAVLGGREEPDIRTLMDALLAYEEDAFYLYNYDEQELLRMFLEGSEDLWGMLDWENGTCDFSGELFAKILQVSERYGYDKRFHYPAVAEWRNCNGIIGFDSSMEQEKEKKVTSGAIFDDGCHAGVRATYFILSMNANSAHKEGAWEFLKFLLEEEAQSALDGYDLPVLKQSFDEIAAELLTHVNDKHAEEIGVTPIANVNGEMIEGVRRTLKDLTEEKIASLKATIEDARPYPIRTGPILDIIQEEAEYYFNGTKDMDEVRHIIENRVMLYMGEIG